MMELSIGSRPLSQPKDRLEIAMKDQTTLGTATCTQDHGEAESLDDFLASVERRAWQMAFMTTRNKDDALDAVQDAMLSFVRNYSEKPAAERRPLFYRILSNRLHDWGRRQQSWGQRFTSWLRFDSDGDGETSEWEPADDGIGPEESLNQKDFLQLAQNVLEQLPARQREAFLLREWEGMDTAATAQAMGVSVGSVKTHYFRAVQKLRIALEEYR